MNQSQVIKAAIFLYSLIIFLLSSVTGDSINDNLFRWISGATSIVVVTWTIYDKWLWRKWIFRYLAQFLHMPILHGTWRGTLQYERDEQNQSGETEVYVAINQTATSISIRSFFKKPSESKSVTAKIENEEPDRKKLVYVYRSEAPYGKRDSNRPHDGTCVLNIVGNPVRKLTGSYFTERKGAGAILLEKRSRELAENLEDAQKLTYV